MPLWQQMDAGDRQLAGRRLDPARDTVATQQSLMMELEPEVMQTLLTHAVQRINGGINDVLLTAFALAAVDWQRSRGAPAARAVTLDLEGHGREPILPGAQIDRTVGWFTSLFPLRLHLDGVDPTAAMTDGAALDHVLKSVKEQLRRLPDNGVGFGLLRHMNPATAPALAALAPAEIAFNYLGRFGGGGGADGGEDGGEDGQAGEAPFQPAPEAPALSGGQDSRRALSHVIELNAMTLDGPQGPRLVTNWSWAAALIAEADLRSLAEGWYAALRRIAAATADPGASVPLLTPSDVLADIDQSDIELLEALYA